MPSARLARPKFFTHPNWKVSLGDEVGEVSEIAGLPPYPEQQLLLDEIFAVDAANVTKSAAFESAAICARQQMKTGLLKQCALGWLYVDPQPLTIWSAHEFSTAQEAFRDMQALIASSPDLDSRVRKIRTAAGSEAIEMMDGSRLKFKARTGGGGRGLTGNKIILDEAFALDASQMGALLPTLISVPDPQVLYASSAGKASSAILRAVRDRGRTGGRRLMYAEWCSERRACADTPCDHAVGHPGCALDDKSLWREACPVTARRDPIEMAAIAMLRQALPPEEFMRECLGWWDEPLADSAIAADKWRDLKASESQICSEPVFGLDISMGREWATIVAAGRNADGIMHVEITSRGNAFDHRPGTDWVIDRLEEIRRAQDDFMRLVIIAGSAAESLVPELVKRGFTIERVNAQYMPAACGHFYDLAIQDDLAHLGQDELTASVTAARRKWVADRAFVWTRADTTVDLTPMYAATIAAWISDSDGDIASNVW